MMVSSNDAQGVQPALERRFEQLPELVHQDEDLVRRGRFVNLETLIQIGRTPFHVSFRYGRIVDLERGPQLMRPWSVAVRATADAWAGFWQPVPEPGYHDVFALTKHGLARIEGELQPLMANLQYFKDVLAAPRQIREVS